MRGQLRGANSWNLFPDDELKPVPSALVQVLSRSAEKSLVAFLTKADHDEHQKLSPAQIALGRELRAARAHKAVAAKGAAAGKAATASSKAAAPRQVSGESDFWGSFRSCTRLPACQASACRFAALLLTPGGWQRAAQRWASAAPTRPDNQAAVGKARSANPYVRHAPLAATPTCRAGATLGPRACCSVWQRGATSHGGSKFQSPQTERLVPASA